MLRRLKYQKGLTNVQIVAIVLGTVFGVLIIFLIIFGMLASMLIPSALAVRREGVSGREVEALIGGVRAPEKVPFREVPVEQQGQRLHRPAGGAADRDRRKAVAKINRVSNTCLTDLPQVARAQSPPRNPPFLHLKSQEEYERGPNHHDDHEHPEHSRGGHPPPVPYSLDHRSRLPCVD